MTVGSDWTNVTLENLVPGRQYTLEMAAVAGPYRSPVRSATDWTCECDSPTSPCCRSQLPPARESRMLTASEWPLWGEVGNQSQGCIDKQNGSQLEPHSAMLGVKGSAVQEEPITEQKTFPNVTQGKVGTRSRVCCGAGALAALGLVC